MRCGGCEERCSEGRLLVATDNRAAKRILEELFMTMGGFRRHLEAYRNKGDFSGVARCELALKLAYSRIRKHCADHDLELPHDVPSEGAE